MDKLKQPEYDEILRQEFLIDEPSYYLLEFTIKQKVEQEGKPKPVVEKVDLKGIE